MQNLPSIISTREGPVHGESLGAPDSRCIGPSVYGRANRHLMGVGNGMGVSEGNVQGGCVEVMKEGEQQAKVIEAEEKNGEISKMTAVTASNHMNVENRSRAGSESSVAVSDAARLWQVKRPRLHESVPLTTDDEMSETPRPRSRGRPPTTGRYVGLARAKAEAARKKREEVATKAEDDLVRDSLVNQYRRDMGLPGSSTAGSADNGPVPHKTVAEAQNKVADNVASITMVATKSGHLKGTFVRALKDAAVSITEAVEFLSSRTTSDETRQLQADNARLQAEMASLRKEMADMRMAMDKMRKQSAMSTPTVVVEELPPVPQSPKNKGEHRRPEVDSGESPMEEICHSVMVQVGEMLNARLAAFEDRLLPAKHLRPPLASDKKIVRAAETSNPTPNQTPGTSQPAKKMRSQAETQPAPASSSTSFQPSRNEDRWEKVQRRKKKKKKEEKMPPQSQAQPG